MSLDQWERSKYKFVGISLGVYALVFLLGYFVLSDRTTEWQCVPVDGNPGVTTCKVAHNGGQE